MNDFRFVNILGRVELAQQKYIQAFNRFLQAMESFFHHDPNNVDTIIFKNIKVVIGNIELIKIKNENKIADINLLKLAINVFSEIKRRAQYQYVEDIVYTELCHVNLLYQNNQKSEAKSILNSENF